MACGRDRKVEWREAIHEKSMKAAREGRISISVTKTWVESLLEYAKLRSSLMGNVVVSATNMETRTREGRREESKRD